MRTKSIRPCQAKNPSACPYHGAMGRMEAALKSDDLPAYFEAKASFEEAKKNKSYLEFEANNGRFMVKGNAEVFTEARVYGSAEVYYNADVPAKTYGNMRLFGSGIPLDVAPKSPSPLYGEILTNPKEKLSPKVEAPIIYGNAKVYDTPSIAGNFRPLKAEGEVIGVRRVLPEDTPTVSGDAKVYSTPSIVGDAKVYSDIPPEKASPKRQPKASDEEKAKAKWFGWK